MNSNETHVIFGTGPLGMAVMRELVKRGKCVRMVNRSGKADVPQGVEVVAGNAYEVSQTKELTKGAAVVYQCAQPAYTEWPEKFPPLQAAILEGAAASNARLIVGDNLYMYGAVKGRIHEDLPYNPHTKKGRTRAQMAQTVLEAHKSGKVRAALARGSDFYGAGVLDSGLGERVFYPALAGKAAQVMGNIDLPHTYTYIDDFGKGMVILGEHEEALGHAWHVPSAETLTTRQILHLIFELAGKEPKISIVSKWMLRAVGLFMPIMREVAEMTYQFEQPFIMDDSKFKRAFGDHATPHHEALKQTLDWYRTHPHS